uniref:Uncharacterized protein n=1 Tax=Arundo donax TaxID=35708 RepID=A0A0A9F0K7_ARUDO
MMGALLQTCYCLFAQFSKS